MAQRLASQTKLKSLQLKADTNWKTEALVPLAGISSLEHLSIQDKAWLGTMTKNDKILQSVLLNSLSTLESLDIRINADFSDLMADWEDEIKNRNPGAMKQSHGFNALRVAKKY